MGTDNSTTVTVDLDRLAADVDRYAEANGISRELAVVSLVRTALTSQARNHVGHAASGARISQLGNVYGNINL